MFSLCTLITCSVFFNKQTYMNIYVTFGPQVPTLLKSPIFRNTCPPPLVLFLQQPCLHKVTHRHAVTVKGSVTTWKYAKSWLRKPTQQDQTQGQANTNYAEITKGPDLLANRLRSLFPVLFQHIIFPLPPHKHTHAPPSWTLHRTLCGIFSITDREREKSVRW